MQSSQLSIEIGTVIRSFVDDTKPPKFKYWVVVGMSGDDVDLATVYVNTFPNQFILRSPVLANAQYPLRPDSRRIFKHDCYADCSTIKRKNAEAIQSLLESVEDCVCGVLYPEEVDGMLKLMRETPNISDRDKKRFGLIK